MAGTQKLTLKAVPPPIATLADFSFGGEFRAEASTTVEPEVKPEKPAVKPAPGPGRDVPHPFQPPTPGKPCRAPDGDPHRKHTVCKAPTTI